MAKLVLEVVDGSDPGRTVKLNGPIEIGSDPAADISLEDPELARRHARITPDGKGGALVEDLSGDGGTFVDELPVEGGLRALPGEEIRVGLSVVALLTKKQANRGLLSAETPTEAGKVHAQETPAAFVPDEVVEDLTSAPAAEGSTRDVRQRYGPLATWTDQRVKHQTFAAAFGLLGITALVVMIFFID